MRRLLPFGAVLLLAACTPQPASSAPGSPASRTVVTFGDSVPAGSACGCTPFPARYAARQRAADVNLSAPGSTSADLHTTVLGSRDAVSTAAEVVIMSGANDMAEVFGEPSEYATVASHVQANVAASVAAIEQIRRLPVIVLGYWNVVEDGKEAVASYGSDGVQKSITATDYANSALQAAARQTGAIFISTDAAFHGWNDTQDPTGLLAPDGDHPNAAGHAAIAALLPPPPSVKAARARSAAPTPGPSKSDPASVAAR